MISASTTMRTVEMLSPKGPKHRVHSPEVTQPSLHSDLLGAGVSSTVSAACPPYFKIPSLPPSALSWANSQVL